VIGNKICEGSDCLKAALSSGVTSRQVMAASPRSKSGGSNEAVTLLYIVPDPHPLFCSMQTQFSETFLIRTTIETLHSNSV
jgi:hypothetical protein